MSDLEGDENNTSLDPKENPSSSKSAEFDRKVKSMEEVIRGYQSSAENQTRTAQTKRALPKNATVIAGLAIIVPVIICLLLISFTPKILRRTNGRRNFKSIFWISFLVSIFWWLGLGAYYYVL